MRSHPDIHGRLVTSKRREPESVVVRSHLETDVPCMVAGSDPELGLRAVQDPIRVTDSLCSDPEEASGRGALQTEGVCLLPSEDDPLGTEIRNARRIHDALLVDPDAVLRPIIRDEDRVAGEEDRDSPDPVPWLVQRLADRLLGKRLLNRLLRNRSLDGLLGLPNRLHRLDRLDRLHSSTPLRWDIPSQHLRELLHDPGTLLGAREASCVRASVLEEELHLVPLEETVLLVTDSLDGGEWNVRHTPAFFQLREAHVRDQPAVLDRVRLAVHGVQGVEDQICRTKGEGSWSGCTITSR